MILIDIKFYQLGFLKYILIQENIVITGRKDCRLHIFHVGLSGALK